MTDKPQKPSDRRPNDEPYYRSSTCNECGTKLVLYESLDSVDQEGWYDEWWCPECEDGIRADWPDSHWNELVDRVENNDDGAE